MASRKTAWGLNSVLLREFSPLSPNAALNIKTRLQKSTKKRKAKWANIEEDDRR